MPVRLVPALFERGNKGDDVANVLVRQLAGAGRHQHRVRPDLFAGPVSFEHGDEGYGGLAFEDEGERCARLFTDPKQKVMIMGNHGVLVIGGSVADTFNRLYYFERAAETYIRALQTGRELRVLSDEVADKVAREVETYPEQDIRHFAELKAILDSEGSDYAA